MECRAKQFFCEKSRQIENFTELSAIFRPNLNRWEKDYNMKPIDQKHFHEHISYALSSN